MRAKFASGADARKHEKLRRTNGPSAEDHLGVCRNSFNPLMPANLNAGGAPLSDHHFFDLCIGDNTQVFARTRGGQISRSGRTTPPPFHGQLKISNAFLIGAVIIGITLISGIHRGIDPFINHIPR